MDRTPDLDSALRFVIGRIAEQAKLSGEPLSDEQRLLLNYLPSSRPADWDPMIPVLVPRNINLERVCALGKAAYQHDRQVNPASLDWEFAFAVFTLDRHPMRSSALGGHETPQAEVGRPFAYCHCFAANSSRDPICVERRWILVPISRNWFGMHSYYALNVLCFEAHRKTTIGRDIERCRRASRFVGTVAG